MTVEAAPDGQRWTSGHVVRALTMHFAGQNWASIAEVTIRPAGETSADPNAWLIPKTDAEWEARKARRIDLLCLRTARKQGIGVLERLAIEVKVTRADFLSDVRNPLKQAPWRELAHRHAYAVPEGLVEPSEVPEGSGLLIIKTVPGKVWHTYQGPATAVSWAKRAPYTDTAPAVPSWLTLALAYRTSNAEARARGDFTSTPLESDPDVLRAEVERLKRELGSQLDRAARSAVLAYNWRTAYGSLTGLPCSTCGKGLKPIDLHLRASFSKWRHVRSADEKTCLPLRTAEAEIFAQQSHANHVGSPYRRADWRSYMHVIDPMPAPIPTDLPNPNSTDCLTGDQET